LSNPHVALWKYALEIAEMRVYCASIYN
jgi:hypothetical protein